MKKANIFALLLFSTLWAFSQQLEVEKMVLKNGLTVYLSEDHTSPEVFGAVITKAGGKNDPKDATGMAHYMEHMLFKGTQELGTTDWKSEKIHIDKIFSLYDELGKTTDEEARKEIQMKINQESLKAAEYAIPNETSNLIKSMGGTNLNAGTGPDHTIFYNAFPPNQMKRWIDLYSHRFIDPVFRSFQAELEVVYEEKNMYSDMFIFPLIEKFNENFFKQHPYGQQTLIGTVDDLKNPSLTKMFEFFKTYYVANNMALIIVGDFDTKKVKPLIQESFGQWRSGDIPEPVVYKEEPFKGRELVEVKMTPVKLGMLGFRTVPKGHEDELILEVCNGILSNSNSTGLLDQLTLDNKMMAAQVMAMPYHDHGASIMLFVPKILGQKLEDAENLVLGELEKLRKGEFEDWMLDAIKYEKYMYYMQAFESVEEKALMISDAFALGKDVKDINDIPEKINKITKEDVIRVANKYYGDNFLAFHSKMGFPKKNKIEKPGYEPLKSNTNAKSKYADYYDDIEVTKPIEKYVDFEKDIKTIKTKGGVAYLTKNPVNDIFSVTIKFGVGEHKMPMLKHAAGAMNYAGTDKYNLSEYKKEFSKIGCTYGIYSTKSYTIIELEGVEKNYDKAIKLLSELISNPVLDQKKIEKIAEEVKTERKMERSEPDNVASALLDYVRYKEQSDYLNRMSVKEIKALQAKDLTDVFKSTTAYFTEVHIVAQNIESKEKMMFELLKLDADKKTSESPIFIEPEVYKENTVFFVNKKKSLQSKIFFLANGEVFDNAKNPDIEAFNLYFGGGFSGLVLQEIREYRSLAYGAGARFVKPSLKGKPSYFMGFVGTQADKTNEALEVFQGLVREMPEKTERSEMIKNYLIQSAFADVPNFRDLSETIVEWKQEGYSQDPAIENVKAYKNFKFSDIVTFYKENVQKAPMVTVLVGNKKRIDMKKVENYGKLIEIKEKRLFN